MAGKDVVIRLKNVPNKRALAFRLEDLSIDLEAEITGGPGYDLEAGIYPVVYCGATVGECEVLQAAAAAEEKDLRAATGAAERVAVHKRHSQAKDMFRQLKE